MAYSQRPYQQVAPRQYDQGRTPQAAGWQNHGQNGYYDQRPQQSHGYEGYADPQYGGYSDAGYGYTMNDGRGDGRSFRQAPQQGGYDTHQQGSYGVPQTDYYYDQNQASMEQYDQRSDDYGYHQQHHVDERRGLNNGSGRPKNRPAQMQLKEKSRSAKERILTPPISPVTTAWDNPFPVFPAKKKGCQSDESGAANGTGKGKSTVGTPANSRPQTSQSNHGVAPRQHNEPMKSPPLQGFNMNFNTREQQDSRPNTSGSKHGNHDRTRDLQQPAPHPPLSRAPPPQEQNGQFGNDDCGQYATQLLEQQFQRSMTMPTNASEVMAEPTNRPKYLGQATWQEPGPMASYHGPDTQAFLAPRPATSGGNTGSRPVQALNARSRSDDNRRNQPGSGTNRPPNDRPPSQNAQADYNGNPNYQYGSNQVHGVDIPNFDAIPSSGHRRGTSIDHHLQAAKAQSGQPMSNQPQELPSTYDRQPPSNSPEQAHRSRPQPDLKALGQAQKPIDETFIFEVPGDIPQVPPIPHNTGRGGGPQKQQNEYGISRSASNEQYPPRSASRAEEFPLRSASRGATTNQGYYNGGRGYAQRRGQDQYGAPPENRGAQSPYLENLPNAYNQRPRNNPAGPGPGPGPVRRASHGRVPASPTSNNPDALPSHPVPVRPGLMPQSGPTHQSAKPVPVRQYDTTAVQQGLPPSQNTTPRPSQDKPISLPVTPYDLNLLQQTVRSNPSDHKTTLVLAKKLVEAASVLADEAGKADVKTRNKNREKYILDAHKLVKKLVNAGDPNAMFYLADCHGQGLLGLEVDPKEAFNLYQSAAKAGHAQSAYRVAVCCEMGNEEGGGTRRDPLKAMQWYKRAATLGDTPAMYKMGMILLKGLLGQPKNPREALSWLKRAADRADEENPHALHELGLLYESASGNDAIVRDEQYSRQLFTQAAELGYKFSQYRLGAVYEKGFMTCPVDPRMSIQWYSRAAAQGEHQSELALSGWYLTGAEGILQQSDTEAYLWARKAAQAGLAKAEYAMGYFTEVGIGAPANIEDAKQWYWRAASQNFPKARERLEDLKKGGGKMQKTRMSRSAVTKQSDGECIVI